MKRHLAALATLATLLLAGAAPAHEVTVGDLQIIHANIPSPIGAARVAAGYMGISNEGDHADTLIGVEVDFAAKAMLHTTEFGTDGVARMKHVEALEVPAGETVVLEPGGFHIMLMGLTRSLAVGDMLPATLIFERGGRIEIEFMVDPADGSVDHSKMDHSSLGDPAGQDHGHRAPVATGDAATDIAALQASGLPPAAAKTLLTHAGASEAAPGPDVIALLDSVDGTLVVGRDGH